jgi:hypothetical protein
MHSAVLIIPAALKPAADAIGAAMGWGPTSYTVPLSADGETVTHYAARADVTDSFVNWITGSEPLPSNIAEHAAPVLAALITDFSQTQWGREHFDSVLAQHNMTIYEGSAE